MRTRAQLLTEINTCADVVEAAIERFRANHERDRNDYPDQVPVAEAMVDASGRPILPAMYADLGTVLAAIATLKATR